MKHFIRKHTIMELGYQASNGLGNLLKKTMPARLYAGLLLILCMPFIGWFGGSTGSLYAQCSTSTPTVLVKWDFNSTTVQCNGAVPKGDGNLTAPFMLRGLNSYCPNVNNGCGAAILGTKGFGNTFDFKNALCLAGFWRNDGGVYAAAPGWTLTDVVFHPEIPANLDISYVLPTGKAGSLTSFSLKILQKQFDGVNPAFEKQGVGVYRNGVLIYSQTQAITAANVNSGTMTFTFPNTPEFISDGSALVTFDVVFGLVHRITKISTGYDDICLIGTCGSGGSPTPVAAISPATCGASSANSDGKITLSNFGAADHYDISIGSSYTGVQTYATSTLIPAGGVITSTLPNPASARVYTVRVFTSAGCTTDLSVTLNPTICSGACTAPAATVAATAATCAGTSPNDNASIAITGVTGGDKVALSPGSFYTGPAYAGAKSLTAGAYTFSALPNPNGNQVYTVRVFSASDNCFKDFPVTLTETSCGCKKIGVQIVASDQGDPDSSPNNNATTEDDYASYQLCKDTKTIDLKLTKTVSPSTGTTCPTNTNFVWTMVLTNAGSMSATNIQVTDNLPADLLVTAASATSGNFTLSGGWLIPSLAAGTSTTLTITTKASKPGTYTNCAWVNGAFPLNDPNSSPLNDYTANEDDDDCASITVTGPKTPEIVKEFSPETPKTNTPFRLTIKITNNESTPIKLTAPLVDNLPTSPAQMTVAPTPNLTTSLPGVVATANGTSITIPAGVVLVPGLNQIQVDVIAPADGEYCNTLAAGALQTTSCNNVAATEACVIVKSTYVMAPLIKKSFSPEIVAVGQSSTLVITIDNRNATGITLLQDFIDEMPSGLVIAGAVTGSCSGVSSFSGTNQIGLLAGSVIAPGICTIRVPVQSTTSAIYDNTIIMNAMIGNVSNGSIPVMTGNEDVSTAFQTVSANPCSALDVTIITPVVATVAPGGVLSLTVNGTGFGPSTLYTWKGTGSFNPQDVTTNYTAPATAGIYTLTAVADNRLTGYGTCKDSTTITVLVQTPVICSLTATATASSQTVCQSQSVRLNAQVSPTGSYTYAWSAPAGITLTGATTATATASMSVSGLQTFTVTVSSSPICSTTATVSVMVNAPTTLPTFQPTTLCEGGSVNFSISPPAGASAYWTTPSNTTINSGTVTIGSVTSADGGTYTLFYTNANGCTSSTTKLVTVNPKPTLTLVNSGCVSGNQSYTVLVSTNATSLTTNASQLGVTISGNLITVPVTVTSFVVSASSAAGCVSTLPVSAPACATACFMSAIATTGQCATATNTYSNTVLVTLNNPTAGTLTVTDGVNSVTFTVPASLGTTTASAVFNGLVSNGASHTVTVSLPGCSTTTTTYTAPVSCTIAPICSVTATATAGLCATATNTYSSTVVVQLTNPTAGVLTITDGPQSATLAVTAAGSATFTVVFPGLVSDGLTHTVTASLPDCSTTTTTYTAPVSCSIAPVCSISAVVTVGVCSTATNTYSTTAVVTVKNPSAGGTVTVSTGGQTLTFSTTAISQNTFTATFNGLISDGSSHTVTASLPGCGTATEAYTAPASCTVAPVCSISAVATTGQCATATNTFSNTITVTMTNPTAGTLTVTDGVNSVTFAVPASLGTTTAVATFNGLVSDGSTHTVTVSLPGCSTTTTIYTAPVACTIAPVCSISAVVTAGVCSTATNTYSATAVVTVKNPSAGGTVTVSTGGQTFTFSTTAVSQNTFTAIFNGLISDGASHTVTASLPGCGTVIEAYTAPVSCAVVPLGSLGDFVWKDSNNNGIQNTGEPGVPSITVELFTVVGGVRSSTPVATTVTSASGLYGFANLPSGQYQVKFTLPASLTGTCRISTYPNTGTDDTKDSDVDPKTGFSQVVTIDATQPVSSTARNNPTIDMGLTIPPSVTITDPCKCFNVEYYVTEKRELYETFEVHSSTGESWSVVSQTGMLALDSLVKHPVIVGTLLTETPAGSGKYQLSFTHENGVGYSVVVTNGSDTLSIGNLCTKYPAYTTTILSNTICHTATPIALTAAAGLPGTTEFFYIDPTTNQKVVITQFDPSQFTVGDTITIKLTITPTDPNLCQFTIVQDVLIGVDCRVASLGDFVWKDNNDNGIQDTNEPGVAGVKVDLFTVVGGVRSTSAVSTTVTDATGHYSFPNLSVGDYQVRFSQIPSSCTLTPNQNAGADDAKDSDVDPTTGFSQVVHLDPSGTGLAVNNLTIDAGLQRLVYDPTGYIYCYKNNTILKGGKISVTGPGSITIVLDGSKGYYRFLTDGTPGSYMLTYSHPSGYSIATTSWPPFAPSIDPTALDGSAQDKDVPANGWVQLGSVPNADTTQLQNGTQAYNPYYLVFNVQAGDPYISSNNLPVDCDLPLGSIGDFVWNDVDKDGQQDSGEPGVNGVTVRLLQQTTPGNYTVVSTTVTSGNGAYLFSNLPEGTYVVEFDKTTLPANFTLTTANASGVPSTLDSDANSITGRSGLIVLVPTNPTQRDILTIDAGIVDTSCPPAKCVPLVIKRTR